MTRALPRLLADPRRAAVGAAVLSAVLLSLTVLLVDAPYVTGDEPPHMDYAYQVWHGDLPVFEDGLVLRPDGAEVPPVQWTAQHPPLFYLLISWFVGPLAEAGHPVAAVYAARALNAVLAGLFVLVTWWSAGRLCRPGSALPRLVAFTAGLAAAVAHAGGNAFNDMLAAVLVTAMFGLGATAIRRGPEPRLVVLLSLLAAACALSRLSTALVAAVIGAVVVLAGALRAAQGRGGWGPVAGLAVGGPLAALAAAGWFYARNLALTGNVQGSHFDWALANQVRLERPVWQVLVDPVTWGRLPDLFWWAGRVSPAEPYPATTMVVTTVLLLWTPLAIALVTRLARYRGPALSTAAPGSGPAGDGTHPADRFLVALLPWAAVATSFTVQVLYSAASGSLFPRYLLPVALPVFLGVAAGLARRPRLLVPLWGAVATADLVGWLVTELTTLPRPGLYAEPAALATAAGVLGVGAAVLATWATARSYPRTAAPVSPPPPDRAPACTG